jgi:Tol biopolymer transport system component
MRALRRLCVLALISLLGCGGPSTAYSPQMPSPLPATAMASPSPTPTPAISSTPAPAPTLTPTATPTPLPISTLRGRIVFVRCSLDYSQCDLSSVRPDGSERIDLTATPQELESFPSVAPDGTWLAFACEPGICRMNADGSGRRVLASLGPGHIPAISPDGQRIAYSGPDGLYVMNADGSEAQRLSARADPSTWWRGFPTWLPSASPLAWSPDGTWIAFGCREGTGNAICLIRSDGSGERVLFSTPGGECCPAWSPDGRSIAIWQGSGLAMIPVSPSSGRPRGQDFPLNAPYAVAAGHTWSPDSQSLVISTEVDPISFQPLPRRALWIVRNVQAPFQREEYRLLIQLEDASCLSPVWAP